MSIEAPNFEAETSRIEHEHRIEAHSQAPEQSEKIAAVDMEQAKTEGRQAVEKAEENSPDTQALLDQLNSEAEPEDTVTPIDIDPKARATMAKRKVKEIQQQETLLERNLSKVIHQPVIRAVSDAAGKTVAHPSGLLGGGLAAFLGSGSYLVLAKYLHFTYNYSVSLILFVGGFFLGLLLELAIHLTKHRQVD